MELAATPMPCASGAAPPPPTTGGGLSTPPMLAPADAAAVSQALTAVVEVLGALARALTNAAPIGTAPVPLATTAPAASGSGAMGAPSAAPSPGGSEPRRGGGVSKARVASFNVLGASHTGPGGNKKGWRTAEDRLPGMIQSLRKHDVEIAGLQEFQESQQRAFKAADTGFDFHGERDNVVAWRRDRYRQVGEKSLTIPYFQGQPRKMPAVLLEDLQTGERVWVLSVHNPADVRGQKNEPHRREAERLERAFVQQLEATGVPVIVTGDFNDRAESVGAMTAGGLTKVAPSSAASKSIDWVFGTRAVSFSESVRDTQPSSDRTSDHPIVVTTATY